MGLNWDWERDSDGVWDGVRIGVGWRILLLDSIDLPGAGAGSGAWNLEPELELELDWTGLDLEPELGWT